MRQRPMKESRALELSSIRKVKVRINAYLPWAPPNSAPSLLTGDKDTNGTISNYFGTQGGSEVEKSVQKLICSCTAQCHQL